MRKQKTKKQTTSFPLWQLMPVMLAFFAMSFVDSVGVATNYVKDSFALSNTVANLCPSMVFFWFLVCSVPTGMLMNKIGRRKTVLASLVVTLGALILPLLGYRFSLMMIAFALLGIGNAMMQVSLNPLVSNIVSGEKLASFMTFGQFVKAIGSFSAPILAAWFAASTGHWTLLYAVFAVEAVAALVWLGRTHIQEEEIHVKTTWKDAWTLLQDGTVLLLFVGIMCHVGIDVGTNTAAPQLLMERLGWPLSQAVYASSVYFMFRTIGCFGGAFLLAKFPASKIFAASVICMMFAMSGMFVFGHAWLLYVCFALVGLGNSNIFSIIFSKALLYKPKQKNEISGLMIMGLFGGTVFPLLMGVASDLMRSQTGAVFIMSAGVAYLLAVQWRMEDMEENKD